MGGKRKGLLTRPELFDLPRGISGGMLQFIALAKSPSKNQIDGSKNVSKTTST